MIRDLVTVILVLITISHVHSSSDCIFETLLQQETTETGVPIDINSFKNLYVQLKEYHDIELQKLQNKYNQLESELKSFSDRPNWSSNSISDCAVCTYHIPYKNVSNDCSNSQTINNLEHKVDGIVEKLSTENQDTNNLRQKVEELLAKFSNEKVTTVNKTKRKQGRYLGCYQDRREHVALRGYIMSSSSNTIESCIDVCRSGNYVYAGLQAGQWCLCGNTLPRPPYNGKLNESSCYMACFGNNKQKCGAPYINSIYETGVEQYLIDEEGHQLLDSYITPSPHNYFIHHGDGTKDN